MLRFEFARDFVDGFEAYCDKVFSGFGGVFDVEAPWGEHVVCFADFVVVNPDCSVGVKAAKVEFHHVPVYKFRGKFDFFAVPPFALVNPLYFAFVTALEWVRDKLVIHQVRVCS